MKNQNRPVPWSAIVLFALFAIALFTFALLDARNAPKQAPASSLSSPQDQEPERAPDCGLVIYPIEEGFFERLLPGMPLVQRPWPKWARLGEWSISFVKSRTQVRYTNLKSAQMHGDLSDPQCHTTPADIPMLIPNDQGIAVLNATYRDGSARFGLTLYDRRGRKLAEFADYPHYPRFSSDGQSLLTVQYSGKTPRGLCISWLDGSVRGEAAGRDLVDYVLRYEASAFAGKSVPSLRDAIFTPDGKYGVAFVGDRAHQFGVVLELTGEPVAIVPVQLDGNDRPQDMALFWSEVDRQVYKGLGGAIKKWLTRAGEMEEGAP